MNRHDIQLLQRLRSYPSVTITLPTHRTSPDNRQDPIRIRNLVTEATNRLLGEFSRREIEPLLTRLEDLVNALDLGYMLDGLALFVNADLARAFQLPFTLRERVVVDQTFATRDLVYALNHAQRYWTLVLSEQPTRLYESVRDALTEVTTDGFPMIHGGPGGEQSLPGGFGVRKSAYRDERHRQFFRDVDSALQAITADDPLPLVVVGVDRYLSFFHEVTSHGEDIVATLQGSHDSTAPHELGALVWPLFQEYLERQREASLAELRQAVSQQKSASTIGEVWRMAHDGRGELLLVEDGYHYPASVDDTGRQLHPADDATAPGVMDDAVDDIIEAVLAKQGRVTFVPNGDLDAHGRIALVLRY